MNQQIEDNLTLGLVRIFSAYGWSGEGTPKTLSQKIAYINWGLHNGEVLDYRTHLKMLIKVRERSGKWAPFTSIYVNGIATLLESYTSFNDLNTIPAPSTKYVFTESTPVGNVFKDTDLGKEVVKRLRKHNKTVLRYTLLEEYGLDKLKEDLQKVFPKGTIYVCEETHTPDQVREWIWDEGIKKMTIYYPCMPLIIAATGKR